MTVPGYNMSLYVAEEDNEIYLHNKAILHNAAREAFDEELSKLKEAIANLEVMSEDKIHQGLKLKHQKSGTWKRMKVK